LSASRREQNDVRQDLEQAVEVAGEAGHPHAHLVPVASDAQRGPDLVHGLGQGQRVAFPCSAAHQLGGEGGKARSFAGDDRRSATHSDAQRHPGQAMVLEHEHLEAVVELGALEAPLLDHGRIPGRRRR